MVDTEALFFTGDDMTRILVGLLVLVALPVLAHDVTATVTAPADGGPVDSYTLVMDGRDVGPVNVGVNSFPGLITADGSYIFEVRATNAAGSMLSDPVKVSVSNLPPPGKPGLSINVTCSPSCIVTVTPQ